MSVTDSLSPDRFTTASTADIASSILIDVSAFCENPFLTGIQRQLEALMTNEKGSRLVPFCIEDHNSIRVLPRRFFDLVRTFFSLSDDNIARMRMHYHGSHRGRNSLYAMTKSYARRYGILVDADAAFSAVTAILNTEYILNETYLDFYAALLPRYNYKLFFMEHDFVFWTLKRHFPNVREHVGHVKHLRLMRSALNVAAVSDEVAYQMHELAGRNENLSVHVVTPGGNSLGSHSYSDVPSQLRIAIVGTIEPRKRSEMILEVLEGIPDGIGLEATFCGNVSGLCSPTVVRKFDELEDPFGPIKLLRAPTDEEIRRVVISSTLTVYLSDGEGFGVPPLESLALGVPVIASHAIPSLKTVTDDGVVKLTENRAEDLAREIMKFVDPTYALELRHRAQSQRVPTWEQFAEDVFKWINVCQNSNRVTFMSQRTPEKVAEVDTLLRGTLSRSLRDPSLLERLGLFDPNAADNGLSRSEMDKRALETARVMRELRRVLWLFKGKGDDYIEAFAMATLKRTWSAEEYWEWRQNWPTEEDSFRALAGFYCSDEAISKDAARPPLATHIIKEAEPLISLFLNTSLPASKYVVAASQAAVRCFPSREDLTYYCSEIQKRGVAARQDYIRALLCSDPAFGRFEDSPEFWAFALAATGVNSPLWEVAEEDPEMEEMAGEDLRLERIWRPSSKPSRGDVALLASRVKEGAAVNCLAFMQFGKMADLEGSAIRILAGAEGHAVFGPYLRLPTGKYNVGFFFADQAARSKGRVVAEVASVEPSRILVQREAAVGEGSTEILLDFDIEDPLRRPIEFRVWTDGSSSFTLSSVILRRVPRPQGSAQ